MLAQFKPIQVGEKSDVGPFFSMKKVKKSMKRVGPGYVVGGNTNNGVRKPGYVGGGNTNNGVRKPGYVVGGNINNGKAGALCLSVLVAKKTSRQKKSRACRPGPL